MLHVGIDPGLTGAICSIDSETREIAFWDTPVLVVRSGKNFKNQQDVHACAAILRSLRDTDNQLLITIEKVAPMPSVPTGNDEERRSMGATSAFNFGMGFGMWIATCAALEIPYQLVHPATWKAALMRDQGKEKDASRVKAMQLYPYTAKDLARKKDHARGDALLLAHYGLMFSSGARPEKVRRPVVERLPNDTPLLFGGSSVQLPKQRTVEEEDDGLAEF